MIFGELGYYSLIFSILFSILLFFFIYQDYFIKDNTVSTKVYSFCFLQFFTIIISFFSLVFSFLLSDFSIVSVFENSHSSKPIFYKFSGTWGNHEGSLLLWVMVLSSFLFLFLLNSKKNPKKYRLLTIFFQNILVVGFLIFIIKTSNPFEKLIPIPKEGLGLNPILQDPALAIHPPILYVGYVGSSIIFSSALASMIVNFVSKIWAQSIKIWVLISWIFLTLGITLGSIWAYYELGWGGFWFWDPVENVSLMPWFALTALLHSIIILARRNVFQSWTIILSIITFTLSMNGTFLVRSGILNSVHTFANDPQRGIFILTFLIFLSLLSLVIFFAYQPQKKEDFFFNFTSKEMGIAINNWFMIFFLSAVLIGTIYPILLEVINGKKISVGPPYYNFILAPFLIPFLVIMTISTKVDWIRSNINQKKKELLFLLIFSFLFILIINYYSQKISIINLLIFFSSLFLIFGLSKDFFDFFKNKKKINLSQTVSHFGFGLLILSIAICGIFSKETDVNLKVGESIKLHNYKLIFSDLSMKEDKNFKKIIGNFNLVDINGKTFHFSPELRIYNQPSIVTSEANIQTNFFKDKYIVMNNISGSDYYNIRFQEKPFMIWIWISSFLIGLGGFLSIVLKRNSID